MPKGGCMKDYRVGQILFLIHDATKVVPVQVVEEVIRTNLNGREKTYIIKFPDKKETQADISKVKSKIFESSEDIRAYMIQNANSAIDAMIEDAANISVNIFGDSGNQDLSYIKEESIKEEKVQLKTEQDIIKVDLGNGNFGKLKMSDIETPENNQ